MTRSSTLLAAILLAMAILGSPNTAAASDPSLLSRAEDGDAIAQFEVYKHYLHGTNGFEMDVETARVWLRESARRGYYPAQMELARRFRAGEAIPDDVSQELRLHAGSLNVEAHKTGLTAQDLFQETEDEPDAMKYNRIAQQHEQGKGAPKDPIRAYAYYHLAAMTNPPGSARDAALRQRDRLTRQMTPGAMTQAQNLARAWEANGGPTD